MLCHEIKESSTSTLTRLAELVLTMNSFSFNNEYYRQIGGVAVGSKSMPAIMPPGNKLILMNKTMALYSVFTLSSTHVLYYFQDQISPEQARCCHG